MYMSLFGMKIKSLGFENIYLVCVSCEDNNGLYIDSAPVKGFDKHVK
jgi:hypothetical protein